MLDESAKQDKVQNYPKHTVYIRQVYGMKVVVYNRGGLTDVRSFFFAWSKACCEKSAEVIVRYHELVWEGLNFNREK
jgi:hypothetical protein